MFDSLNHNAGALSFLVSLAVMITTIVYAWLTRRLVKETISMRQVYTEPEVIVTAYPSKHTHNIALLVVENIGLGVARNIKFSISPNLEDRPNHHLYNPIFIKRGLDCLLPHQRLESYLCTMFEGHRIDVPFEVKVTFENSAGIQKQSVNTIDLSVFIGIVSIREASIEKSIKKIADDIHNIATGWNNPEIIVQVKEKNNYGIDDIDSDEIE